MWPFNRKQEPKYIMTNDGNITLMWNGKAHAIGKTHRNYDAIVAALVNKESKNLDSFLNVAATVERSLKGVTVNEFGEVFYGGVRTGGIIADKITEFVRQGLPYKPLARFLTNLMDNPSDNSRNELYDFLAHGGFPITHDGCFLAYKGLTDDFKDRHTRTVDNSIGSVNEMPREQVDPSTLQACSTGYHVGTHRYASDFASTDGRLVLVKVNPRDAVSVPRDHSCEKLRVCRYEVVEICERLIEEPLYRASEYIEDDGEEEEYDDGYGDDLDDDDDGLDADNESAVAVKVPKRAACTYCGSKGGKRHAGSCRRPQR